LIFDVMIDPKAGIVPGTKDPIRLAAPSATSSRFGLMVQPKRSAFCFAATVLSKNPMMVIKLNGVNMCESKRKLYTYTAVEVVYLT